MLDSHTPIKAQPDWISNPRPLDHDRTVNASEKFKTTQPSLTSFKGIQWV